MTASHDAQISRLAHVIEDRFGLAIDDAARGRLGDLLRGHRPPDLDALADAPWRAPAWARITDVLCVPETWFFRDPEQLSFAAHWSRERHETLARPLRALSAGCATGEEPYTLAMLALEHIGRPDAMEILGVDVDARVIAHARAATYGRWALRHTSAQRERRHFVSRGALWAVHPDLRRQVRFERENLVSPDATVWARGPFDLILCRNMLMYLQSARARDVLARMVAALAPGGRLQVASVEASRLRAAQLGLVFDAPHGAWMVADETSARAGVRPRSRRLRRPRARALPVAPAPSETPTHQAPPPPDLERTLALYAAERYEEALACVAAGAAPHDDPPRALVCAALLLQTGAIDEAIEACSRLLDAPGAAADAHYIVALCLDARGDVTTAAGYARAAAALDPTFALAHLHLARIARRGGDAETARQALNRARTLLPGETSRRILLFGGGFDREALDSACRAELDAATALHGR